MKEVTTTLDISNCLQLFNTKIDCFLVIDAKSFERCILYNEKYFIKTLIDSAGLICFECSLQQKGKIAELLKKYSKNAIICSIGDGVLL